MKRSRALIVIMAIVALGAFFYPKPVGGPMCGPVCPSHGLHNWERNCLGFQSSRTMIDSYVDLCYGIPISKVRCHGVPFDGESDQEMQLDCNYPCSDQWVRSQCTQLEVLDIAEYHVDCFELQKWCNWS